MSPTTTSLGSTAISTAFDRIESIYEALVDDVNRNLLSWGAVDVNINTVHEADLTMLIGDVRRAAVAKWALSRLIRTRPEELPPANLKYPTSLLPALVELGDALDLDGIAVATSNLQQVIAGSAWDFDAEPAQETPAAGSPDDGLGFNTDLGEVVPGPEEPGPPAVP